MVCRAGTDRYGNATWECRCVCSTETIVTGANLRNGSTRSCGCLQRELTIERNKGFVRHGHARRSKKTREYASLQNAIYGKRATICKRWRNSFPAFLADMGRKPSPAHRLKRLDNSKGYTQANCVWLKNKRPPARRTRRKSAGPRADRPIPTRLVRDRRRFLRPTLSNASPSASRTECVNKFL